MGRTRNRPQRLKGPKIHPLAKARIEKTWTQDELARRSKVSVSTIERIERYIVCPNGSTRRKLLKPLGIGIERHQEMFGGMRGVK